ncbi:MAG: SDR family NAD(P)-dependent oxidoreductase [Actinomycetota bacterium]|nr:SDR family NAD(P)-dependent oxidoreductase [Actinomycetota bacterium]
MSIEQVWLITGASRGLGKAIARQALGAGHSVVATSRSVTADMDHGGNARFLALALDVASHSEGTYETVVQEILTRFGRIDVLVNNAGFGDLTALEESDDAQVMRTYETNLFGLMRVTRAVLPVMRRQGCGRILNITSSAGNDGRGPALYHSVKAAAKAFTESLSFEVGRFGIKPTNVAPGLFRTDFLDGSSMTNEPARALAAYDEHRAMIKQFTTGVNHQQAGDPHRLARLLVEVAASENPPLHLLVGSDAMATLENHHRDVMVDVEAWRDESAATSFGPEDIRIDPSSFFKASANADVG